MLLKMESIMPNLDFMTVDDFSKRLGTVIEKEKIDINQPVSVTINHHSENDYLILIAARLNCGNMVNWLMSHGADVSVCDESRFSAYDYAIINNNSALANQINEFQIGQENLIRTTADEMIKAFYTQDPQTKINSEIGQIPSYLRESVQELFALGIKKRGVQLGSIHRLLKELNESSFDFIARSLDDLVSGEKSQHFYLGLLGYAMVFETLILDDIVSSIYSGSTQLVAFNRDFNPVQTFLIFYESDEKHYNSFVILLSELKKQSSYNDRRVNQLDFTDWIENSTHYYSKQEEKLTRDNRKLMMLAQDRITSNDNNNKKTDYGLRNKNENIEDIINIYAEIDNALMLAVRSYNENKFRLVCKLAEESALHCLAEVIVRLSFSKSINTASATFAVEKAVYPTFFSGREKVRQYVEHNLSEGKATTAPRRLAFLFYINRHEQNVAHHQILQALFGIFIDRCNNLSKEQSKRDLMRILEARGEAFYDKKQYVWASCSFRAAQLFYSMLKQTALDDYAWIFRLLDRFCDSLKNIDNEDCSSLSEAQYKGSVTFIDTIFKCNNLSDDDKTFLTDQQAYKNILSQPIKTILNKYKTQDPSLAFRRVAASPSGFLDDMRRLVGAYPDIINDKGVDSGQTALHRAVISGHIPVVSYLVCDLRVDRDIKDKEGKIAFEYINTHCAQPNIVTQLESIFATTLEECNTLRFEKNF